MPSIFAERATMDDTVALYRTHMLQGNARTVACHHPETEFWLGSLQDLFIIAITGVFVLSDLFCISQY